MNVIEYSICMKNMCKLDKKKIKQCARLAKHVYYVKEDVIICETKNETIIVIDGTDTISKWVDNISIGLRKNDIHEGFFRYSTQCIKKYNLRQTINNSNKPIYLCGHSLGAAAATIIAFKLAHILQNKECNLVLFGSPKPGGQRFANNVSLLLPNANIYNIQSQNDIICRFPLNIFGYYHITDEILYIQSMFSALRIIQNHNMNTYIDGL